MTDAATSASPCKSQSKPVTKTKDPSAPLLKANTRWQRALRQFFAKVWVEIVIAILVVISVLLTLTEVMFEASTHSTPARMRPIQWINDSITAIFGLELSLRFLSATSKRRFFRDFWLDILAVLPLFHVFRSVLPLKLLRLFRVFRLLGVATRLTSNYPYIFRRGAIEYLVVCGMLVVTVTFATVAIMYFENGASVDRKHVANNRNDAGAATDGALPDRAMDQPAQRDEEEETEGERFDFESSFWFSLYSLFAGEPVPQAPRTVGGKIVSVIVMFMGLTIFAMFTGTVSAFMVDRFRTEGQVVDIDELHDHIVICGWNTKTEIIIQEYRASKRTKRAPIIVISEQVLDQSITTEYRKQNVSFLLDDFTRVSALKNAAISEAKTCIILADTSGGRSEQDADARTILAALTVEKINPGVFTCAELINRSYGMHLEMGHVNDYVVSGEYSAYMLAQSAMNRGLMGVLGELLTYQRGNEFYRQPIPAGCIGKSFIELMVMLKQEHNAILVAIHPKHGEMTINPDEHVVAAGDEMVVIAQGEISTS